MIILTFNQCVLVGRRGSSQHAQFGPDFIDAFLLNLCDGRKEEEKMCDEEWHNKNLLCTGSLDVTANPELLTVT